MGMFVFLNVHVVNVCGPLVPVFIFTVEYLISLSCCVLCDNQVYLFITVMGCTTMSISMIEILSEIDMERTRPFQCRRFHGVEYQQVIDRCQRVINNTAAPWNMPCLFSADRYNATS